MTEKEFSLAVVNRLKNYFTIEEEIWSVCGKKRIDYVANHLRAKVSFGLEFKRFDRKRGVEIGEFIIQAYSYTKLHFKTSYGEKLLNICICPPLSYNYLICREGAPIVTENQFKKEAEYFCDRHNKNDLHHTVNGMLGAFGVSELRKYAYDDREYLRVVFNNKEIWNERFARDFSESHIYGFHSKNIKLFQL